MSEPEPSPFGDYVSAWRARWRRDQELHHAAVEVRRVGAEALLPQLVAVLVREFGAKRVWLVGSLARGDFGAQSDIDLAVEGLASERWLEAERAAEDVAAGTFAIEIVPIEGASHRFREAIAKEGRLLHGG